MLRRRRSKRPVNRVKIQKSRWNMKRRRSPLLKLRQLCAGKLPLVVLVFLMIFGGLYATFFTALFSIAEVEVTSSYKDINTERVRESIWEEVGEKNTLLVRYDEVERTMYDLFPEISSLQCTRNLFRQAFVCEAIGYEIVAVIKHQDKRYYINENGVVIAFDNRKLGLPLFDLILNPLFAEDETPKEPEPIESLPVLPASPLSASILGERTNGVVNPTPSAEATPESPVEQPENRLNFLQPFDAPPIEPVIKEQKNVFQIAVGKKLLDPDELSLILQSIQELEKVLERKVIHAQYVQVAGELSLTSKPQVKEKIEEDEPEDSGEASPDKGPGVGSEEGEGGNEADVEIFEDPNHEFTVLLNLRRDLEDQLIKLKKSKEVIDFSEVSRIDLSIDGEKVFYR